MYSFIVLGIVPGTNIQISFQAWLLMLAGLVALIMVFIASHRLRRSMGLQGLRLRQPLDANQLHQQVQ
jgi:hypothetical protein